MVQGTHCAHPLLEGTERSQVGSLKGIAAWNMRITCFTRPTGEHVREQGSERTNPSHTSFYIGQALFLIPTSSLSGDQAMASSSPECHAKWSTKK